MKIRIPYLEEAMNTTITIVGVEYNVISTNTVYIVESIYDQFIIAKTDSIRKDGAIRITHNNIPNGTHIERFFTMNVLRVDSVENILISMLQ